MDEHLVDDKQKLFYKNLFEGGNKADGDAEEDVEREPRKSRKA